MNEQYIQTLLMDELLNRQHRAVVPNSTMLLHWEADLLSVTKAGLVNEFEIKCSKSDYNREFRTKRYKHQSLSIGAGGLYCPNYFWFVTHGFDILPPAHAGWIKVESRELGRTHWLTTKKNAPRLHAAKWDDNKIAKIARLLSYRLLKEYKAKYNV